IPSMPDLGGLADQAQAAAGGLLDQAQAAAGGLAGQAQQAAGGLLQAATGGGLPGVPPLPGMPDLDNLYEGILERLKRDLLAERERMGDLLGNLGH
ncbi:MAG: hypothetical protein AB7O53_15215, partial [Thermoleophilia bacterium]